MRHSTSRHVTNVNASVALYRALWQLRGALNKSTEEILQLSPADVRKLSKPARGVLSELRKELDVLRAAWPKETALACIDIATSITQAASIALTWELGLGSGEGVEFRRKPVFPKGSKLHTVVRLTVEWMFHVSGRTCDVGALLARIQNRPLNCQQAQDLRDSLVHQMPGILQWADEQALRSDEPL